MFGSFTLSSPKSKRARLLLNLGSMALLAIMGIAFLFNRLPVVFSHEMLLYYVQLPTEPFNITLYAFFVIGLAVIFLYSRKTAQYETLYNALTSSKEAHLILNASQKKIFSNPSFDVFLTNPALPPLENLKNYFDSSSLNNFIQNAIDCVTENSDPQDCCISTKNNQWYHLRVTLVDEGSKATLWSLEDITETQRRAEESERKLRRLSSYLDIAHLGFFNLDENGRFLYANTIFSKWLGYDQTDLEGKEIYEFAENQDALQILKNFTDEDAVIHLKSKNGATFQALLYKKIVNDGDVSRRISAARNLSHEDTPGASPYLGNFRHLFEEAPVGVVLLDTNGLIQDCNQTFRSMLGDKDTNFLNMNFCELVDHSHQADVLSELTESSRRPGEPIEVQLHDKNNLTASLYVRRIEDQGKGPCLLLHFIDITEQKKLQVQVIQSQKMQAVGKLAGGIAHDFNNLLTAMLGYCDLLLQRHSPGDPSFTDIMQIKQNTNRAANLVRQLLAFSRQQSLQPRGINITDCLAELSNLVQRLIGTNLSLKMVHGHNLWGVKADQGQLEQVIINLVVNSRDAMPEGGKLTISTENVVLKTPHTKQHETILPGEYVLIKVQDTGSGIAKENLEHIFDPFFTTKEVGAGTGLGLSTVYGIIKQTHGYIHVDSELDVGTTFEIYLPRYEAKQEKSVPTTVAEETEASQDLTGTSTILLVEDEEAVRRFCVRALRDKGYDIIEACDGQDALEKARSYNGIIDLLVTDVVMPSMNGPTLTEHIKEIFPGISVIFISGYTEDTFRQDLDQNMDIHFLSKPFSFKQLVAKVHQVLDARGHLSEETAS